MCHESWLFEINTLIGLGLFSIIKKSVHNNLHTICKFWENVFCKLKESCGCFKSQVRMRLNFIPDVLWSIGSEAIQIFYFSNWQISLTLKRGFYTYCLSPQATAWITYFAFTRLNLYLDLLQVIGFRHFIALWKALNKRKQIAQFLRSKFRADVCKDAFKENLYISNNLKKQFLIFIFIIVLRY